MTNSSSLSGITFVLKDKIIDEEHHILIIDIGGWTTGIPHLSVTGYIFEVVSTSGDNHLWGEYFDNKMIEYFWDFFQKKFKSDHRQSPRSLRKLRTGCENAKRTLSTANTASIVCDSIYEGHDFVDNISRAMFENLNDELFRSNPIFH